MRVQNVAGAELVIYTPGKRATKRCHIMLLCIITWFLCHYNRIFSGRQPC